MKFILEIEAGDNEINFVKRFLKHVSFKKNIKIIASNEITNKSILQSIEAYENGCVAPTPLNLTELKSMINS